MAEAGRPKAPLTLADGERAVLQRWARRPRSAQALALRSKIVLACAEGTANKEVAARLGVTPQMVGKWRARFVAARLDGLADEPRPGQPRKITDEQVEAVIVKTLEDKPPNQDTHWSTRSMAKATGLNQTAVSRIWRAFGLKPHVQETWKLSADPQFIEKVRDIVGLYMNPPEHALVLCVDEKTQIQAIDRTAPCLPILPTTPARHSHGYVRNGTTSLFAALVAAAQEARADQRTVRKIRIGRPWQPRRQPHRRRNRTYGAQPSALLLLAADLRHQPQRTLNTGAAAVSWRDMPNLLLGLHSSGKPG
jgi:transposase